MKKSRYLVGICCLAISLIISACGPGQAFGPKLTLVPSSTPNPTSTNTPIPPTPTSTNTLEPTNTNTPEPTATITLDATASVKYFKQLLLATQDGVTASVQFLSGGLYCLRHVAPAQINGVQTAIFNPATGKYEQDKNGIYDGEDSGVVQRGDRSSCTALPALEPGQYQYEVWVGEILVARLPFEIIK